MFLFHEAPPRLSVPRIARYAIHNSRGGFVDVYPRSVLQPPVRIDTVPKHARKVSGEVIGANGVVLPIVNPWNVKRFPQNAKA